MIHLYRLLLRAYPRDFGAAFAEEMQAVFAEALDAAARAGSGAALGFCARELMEAPSRLVEAHWRSWHAGQPMSTAAGALNVEADMLLRRPLRVYAGIALILLALAIWIAAVTGLGLAFLSTILPALLVATLMMGVLAGVFAPVLERLGRRVWVSAGLLCLAGLARPTSALVEPPAGSLSPLSGTLLFVLPSAAVIAAALLLAAGLGRYGAQRGGSDETATPASRRHISRLALASLALSALLVAKTLHNLYWLLIWDSTTDPLEFLWLIPPTLAALFSGVVLTTGLEGKARWAGLYGLAIPALLLGVLAQAERVDFRQLTSQRAEQVSRALDNFYASEGRYPQDLRQLAPWYEPALPGPVIINGQTWCYQAGDDYYRLGYVDREHWSSPILFGRLARARGQPAEAPPLCAAEIAALQQAWSEGDQGWGWPVSGAAIAARVQAGTSRAEVLRQMGESWHRDGCSPQRPTGSGYVYTELFWYGSRDVAQATVVAVHYQWTTEHKTWSATGAEAVKNNQLLERYSRCTSLDLAALAGTTQ